MKTKRGYATIDYDDEMLEDLLIVVNPDTQDKVVLGAISLRYEFPHPLAILAQDIAEGWGLTLEQLQKECRAIWAGGYRPRHALDVVGSAYDEPNSTKEDSHDFARRLDHT